MDREDYKGALKEVHSALEKTHDEAESATLLFYEGGILFRMGYKTDACEVFLKVLKQQPNAVLPVKLRPEFQQRLEELRPELEIRALREKFKYQEAFELVSALLQKQQGHDERERLLLYKAILLYELHKQKEGRDILGEVVSGDVGTQLPLKDVSPKILDDFDQAREEVRMKQKSSSGGARQYAWIPAAAGGALVIAAGATLIDTPLRNEKKVAGISMLCVGTASLFTAVLMYVLGPNPNTTAPQASIAVGTNGASAVLSFKWP